MIDLLTLLLMLTSYARVFATLLYFAFTKNLKYTPVIIAVLIGVREKP